MATESPLGKQLSAQDAAALGVETDSSVFAQIDMPRFVQLTETYPRQLAWY